MATVVSTHHPFNFLFQKLRNDKQLKLPLCLAILIHVLALGIGSIPTSLFQRNLNLEEIYTVDLFDIEDPSFKVETTTPAPAIEPPPPPLKQAAAEPLLSIAQGQDTPPAGPVEIISLKPRRIKKNIHLEKQKAAKAEEFRIKNAISKLKNKKAHEEAIKKAAEAKATADAAAQNAVDMLRAAIRAKTPRTSASPAKSGSINQSGARRSGGSIQVDAALKQYYISVSQKIHHHWVLPEMQKWDENLEAIIVVYVRKDGIVTKKEFEKKSPNLFFNQFVEKTLRESLPLPPFPPGLKHNELEIGLVFHPAGLI
jgi:outer membrane biosynthesis protein TonB